MVVEDEQNHEVAVEASEVVEDARWDSRGPEREMADGAAH